MTSENAIKARIDMLLTMTDNTTELIHMLTEQRDRRLKAVIKLEARLHDREYD